MLPLRGASGGTQRIFKPDMNATVSITRSADSLQAYTLNITLLQDAQIEDLDITPCVDFAGLCRAEMCAIGECPAFLTAGQERLQSSWQALGAARTPDADTLLHVLLVLLETSVRPDLMPALPALTFGEPGAAAAPHKPTAVHPRAYKGTKHQPPRPAPPDVLDLRPYLCDAHNTALILTRLRPFAQAAVKSLRGMGYMPDICARVSNSLEAGTDVYASAYHDAWMDHNLTHLPAGFRIFLLPLLRGQDGAQVRACIGLYWKLGLDSNIAMLAAFTRLVTLQNTADASHSHLLQWGHILAQMPTAWRLSCAALLAQTRAYRADPRLLSPRAVQWLGALDGEHFAVYRLYSLLHALALGVDADYMLDGFALADFCEFNSHRSDFNFHYTTQAGYFPAGAVRRIGAHCPVTRERYDISLLNTWKASGAMEGFGRLVEQTRWEAYTPQAAYALLNLPLSICWQDWTDTQKQASWRLFQEQIRPLEVVLADTSPEYQHKGVLLFSEWFWEHAGRDEARERLPFVYALIRRVCRPPFHTGIDAVYVAAQCAQHLAVAEQQAMQDAPDSSWLRLEEACASRNNAQLVEAGFDSLLRLAPAWTAACFACSAAKLCRVARLCGCFSDALRDRIAREFIQTLTTPAELCALPPGQAVERLDACCSPGCTPPVPRALREHLAGTRLLSEERLRHNHTRMMHGALLMQLEQLEQAALAALCTGFATDASEANVAHALQMRLHVMDNRRALSKYLRSALSGNTDYIAAHPRSHDWLRRHPTLNLSLWQKGIDFAVVGVEGLGSLHIAVEQDPLEALRMGTYVGSCLGSGGSFAYSAVANMLDINKQTLYARDENGRVVARQLAAITEANQLACFEVYPYPTRPAVQRLFARYDALWADALGMELYRPGPDMDCTIVNVLSTYWWDDSPWDFVVEEVDKLKLG